MTSVLAHLGDRVNPIVVKEVRQAVNSRIVAGALLLFLAVQLVVMSFQLLARNYSPADGAIDLKAGREVFGIVQGILVGTCILIIPAFTGARLAGERSEVNVDLMFITSLSPWKIISGKFLASAALVLLIFSACAPFMTFAYVLRGLDIPTILVILYMDFLAVLLGTIFAIFLAAIPASRGFRIVVALLGIIGLGYLMAGTIGLSQLLLVFEVVVDVAKLEFWMVLAGGSVLVIGAIGLFFVWSVALITPVSSNRALPMRLYTFGLWLVTGVGCLVATEYLKDSELILAWTVGGTIASSLQMVIAISERDEWGVRMLRRIPRHPIGRAVAMLFSSGSFGGIAFAVLGAVGSILPVLILHQFQPALRWTSYWEDYPTGCLLMFGYTYCYGMTAVLIRRLGKSRGVQPYHTWAIGMILFGIGCALPYLVKELVEDRNTRYRNSSRLDPIFLTNPIETLDPALRNYFDAWSVSSFLIVWASVMTLINAQWMIKQVIAFRRPPKAIPPVPFVVPEPWP